MTITEAETHLNGDTPEPTTLEGLCFVGTLIRVEPARFKDGGDIIEGLANAIFSDPLGNHGERKINLAREVRQLMGPVTLPAFAKLAQAMPGTRWLVTLKSDQSPSEDGKRVWMNYTAIDAQRA
ncbi:MAG: hypothetical protein JWM55_229 [Acidimicrobiaceae bacterium]|nr:hypothetical protein [Acidimicrobiaceae bacterium]